VIILTSDTNVDTIVSAMRLGAYDYVAKPVQRTDLGVRIKNGVESYRMSLRLTHLEREAEGRAYPGMVGNAPPMRRLFRQMDRLAASDITLLIHGESGSGKELVARAIHAQSGRRHGPFVAVNCAAIPETLQESELFGHEKGSFTGATARRIGKFEQADRGTLFLDEVAELSLPLQAKLLRALQERSFQRVGGSKDIPSDFRLIAATHRDLAQQVREGRFRDDLYFRIVVFDLEVPPLRERPEDIPLLAATFVEDYARKEGREALVLSPEAIAVLSSYPWPGNVRELQNAMQRATVICEQGMVRPTDLPPRLLETIGEDKLLELAASAEGTLSGPTEPAPPRAAEAASAAQRGTAKSEAASLTLEEMEREMIASSLERLDGNLSLVCRQLGIGRTTLYRKLKKYRIR
jgi:two-component system response regulator HydG